MSGQFHLLKEKRFLPFFSTQFLGAFNDNVFKNALIVLLTFHATSWTTLKPEVLSNLAAGIFILPFFLFSATAGQLADKYDKAKLARLVKVLEIGIMLIAAAGFALQHLELLMTSLFLMGLHSTLFGPVKYAILPQHLKENELIGGNALIEAGTFVAILFGTLAGGILAAMDNGPAWISGFAIAVAVAGYVTSRGIPVAPPPVPDLKINLNPLSETWRNIGFARDNRTVFLAILGISWFWLYGALFLAQFPAFAKNVLGGGEMAVTLLLAVFIVGISVGSLLCERLSGKHVEIGLVPFGSIGLTIFGLDLAFASPGVIPAGAPLSVLGLLAIPQVWHVLIDLMLLGVFGGFFIVPLYALIQVRSATELRARVIAANNIVNALFMVAGSLAAAALLDHGLSIPALFGVAAICNAAVALYIYKLVPEFLQRFIVWLLVHTVYRLKSDGVEENVPEEGGAVLVCNHVSSVDPLLVMAACRRPIRFLVDERLLKKPLLGFVLRQSRAIPLPADGNAAATAAACATAADALAAGELIGVFPEGAATPDGELHPFQPLVERIVDTSMMPVVPLALRGMWESPFSRQPGSRRSRLRARIFSPHVVLTSGAAMPAGQAKAVDLHGAVGALLVA